VAIEGEEVDPNAAVVEEEEDKNRVIFKPSLQECEDFVVSCMGKIIESSNRVNNLESDLMPFLTKVGIPNFPIDDNFPWITDGVKKLQDMI